MAKRDNASRRTNRVTTAAKASGPTTTDTMEERVVAFAEQLGRIAGTVHAKAEGWMDRETLSTQIAGVRDAAADLLERLARGATMGSAETPPRAVARHDSRGRSGSVVDAPGKRHRPPMKSDPGANVADSQAAKMRTAKTMVKTNRRRGRG